MSLFGGFSNKPILDILEEKKGPSIVKKIDMLFMDVETEGKKQGYERASKEYKKVFIEIEQTYEETRKQIEYHKNIYGNRCDKLIDKLELLEIERDNLKRQVDSKVDQVSMSYNIPKGQIYSSMYSGTILSTYNNFSILDIIYNHKEKKLKQAQEKGYLEAKKIYEEKIKMLKADLEKLKIDGNREIENMINLIDDVVDEIVKNHMSIAELRILL